MFDKQKGQGLVAYAIILTLVAITVIAVIVLIWAGIIYSVIIPNWDKIVSWGADLVSQIQHGDPKAIFAAIVIVGCYAFLINRNAWLPLAIVTVVLIAGILVR
mgnify:CR=1 FL=1